MNKYKELFLFVLAQLEYLSDEDSSGIDELRNEIWAGHMFIAEAAHELGLITDEERAAEDDYPIQDHVITSAYTQVHDHPVYKADDETFSALWMKTYASIDTENKLLTYYTTDENFIVQYDTFSYDGY